MQDKTYEAPAYAAGDMHYNCTALLINAQEPAPPAAASPCFTSRQVSFLIGLTHSLDSFSPACKRHKS